MPVPHHSVSYRPYALLNAQPKHWRQYRCQDSVTYRNIVSDIAIFVLKRDVKLGTCESFFCIRIESRIESAVRFDFESNFRIESAAYTTQAVTPSNELLRYLFCICHEREWCTQLSTCYSFQFSPKTRQTMPLYDYLTPKLEFKRKFNRRQSFLYKGRLTVRTIRKFRIGSSLRIESRIGSLIRNRIESRSFAGA